MKFSTFVIETIKFIDFGGLMVSPKHEEVLWILDLVGQQEHNGFKGVLATINIIAEEEIIGSRGVASVLEYLD